MTRAEAVSTQGAVLLDRVDPDWWRRVDVRVLRTYSTEDCVLGQAFDDFTYGCHRLGLGWGPPWHVDPSEKRREHGFTAETDEDYRALDLAWADRIAERRDADAEVMI